MKRFVSLLSVLLIIACGVIAGVFTHNLPVRKVEALNAVWEHLHFALSAFNGMFASVLVFLVLVVLRKLPASVMNFIPSDVDSHPSYGCDTEYKLRDNRLNLNWHIAVYLFAAIAILYIPLFGLAAVSCSQKRIVRSVDEDGPSTPLSHERRFLARRLVMKHLRARRGLPLRSVLMGCS